MFMIVKLIFLNTAILSGLRCIAYRLQQVHIMNCRYFYELSHASLILTTQFILQRQFVNMQSDRLYNKFFFVRTKRYFMIQLYIYFGCNLNEQYSLLIFDVHHRIFRLNFLSRFRQFHFILIFTYIYENSRKKNMVVSSFQII